MKPHQNDQNEFDQIAGLAAPARRALAQAGIANLAQLAEKTEAEILSLHGLGINGIKALRRALEAKGLAFTAEKPPSSD